MRSSTSFRFGIIACLISLSTMADVPLSYTGRLVNSNGSPVAGPVTLKVELARTDGALPPSVLCTQSISSVPLSNGVFHLKIDFTNVQCGGDPISKVLADTPPGESAAIRVTDVTNSKVYSFQAIHAIPFSSVSYYAKSLAQMGAVAGQVLSWNGTQWAPASAGGTGSVSSVATGAGLTGGPITASGTISVATGGITAAMLAQMGAVLGNTLKWNGSAWAPSADAGITSESDPSVQGWAKNSILTCTTAQTLRFDALLNSGSGGLYCSNIALGSDAIAEGSTNLFFTEARAKTAAVANSITDAVTDVAPSQNAVFDALTTKQNTLNTSSNLSVASLQASATLSGTSGVEYGARVTPTINQSSAAGYTGLLVNVTETTTGSGLKKLLDLQVGGVSKFSIDANGTVSSSTATQGTTANYTSAGGSQLTVGYDTTNKTTMNVDPLGFTTLSAAGTAAGFNFTGGNVGIGTPAPQFTLDVNGPIGVGARIYMDRDPDNMSWIGARGTDGEPAAVAYGFSSSATGTVLAHKFFTSGTHQMSLTAAGNLGLGTDTPGFKFEVGINTVAEQPAIAVVQSGAGDGIFTALKPGVRRWSWGFDASDFYKFKIATTGGVPNFDTDTALTIDANKDVGIGTSTPTSTLHVVRPNSGSPVILSSGYTDNQIEMNQDGSLIHTYSGSDHRYVLSSNSMADVGGLLTSGHDFGGLFLGGASSFSGITAGGQSLHSGQRELYFWTNNNYLFPKMLISAAGNVGIGMTDPAEKLSLYGSDNAAYTSTGAVGLPGNGTASMSIFNDAYTDGASAFLNFKIKNASASVDSAYIGAISDTGSSQTAALIFGQRTGVNSYAERMRIGFNGNVGIGTTATDAKLNVDGNIAATGYRAGQGAPNNSDASTNGFAFGADGDTGIFSPGAGSGLGILGFYANGSEVMRLNDSRFVGIQTTTPSAPLEVSGPNMNTTQFKVTNPNSSYGTSYFSVNSENGDPYTEFQRWTGIGSNYSGTRMQTNATGDLLFSSSGYSIAPIGSQTFIPTLFVNRHGQVGVGTTAPDPSTFVHLHGSDVAGTDVLNDGNDRPTLQVEGSFPNLILKSQGNASHSATIGLWAYDGAATTHQWNMGVGQNGIYSMGYTTNSPNPHVGVANLGTASILSLNPSGKVGVGTLLPNTKFEVVDTATQLRLSYDATHFANFDVNSAGELNITSSSGVTKFNNGLAGLEFTGLHNRSGISFINKASSNWLPFATLNSSGSENVYDLQNVGSLTTNGNVGIGTTNPTTRLTVDGTATISNSAGSSYNENLRLPPAANDYASIAFGSDPNSATGTALGQWTFVRYPTATYNNLFGLRHNSTDLFNITTSGNVGIGTTTPDQLFVLNKPTGTIDPVMKFALADVGKAYIGVAAQAGNMVNNSVTGDLGIRAETGDILFGTTAGTERLRITSAGNVGIGTPTPATKLEVALPGAGTPRWNFSSGLDNPRLEAYRTTGLGSDYYGYRIEGGVGSMIFSSASGAGIGTHSFTEKMRIDNNGNIGINNNNPLTTLDVHGRTSVTTASGGVFKVTGSGTGFADATDGVFSAHSENTAGSGGNVLKASSAFSPDAFFVKDNGNVGIGTGNPDAKLGILTPFGGDALIRMGVSGVRAIDIGLHSDGLFSIGDYGSRYLNVATNGDIGIGLTNPGERLDVSGNINASGIVRASGATLTSDLRLKEQIQPIGSSLAKILKLKGYSYHWKDKDRFTPKKQIGLIAQEVKDVFPEAVSKGADGFFSVSYNTLLAPVIEAIKELHALFIADQKITTNEVRALKRENARLAQENQEIKARLDRIERSLTK